MTVAIRHHALESACFVVNATGWLTDAQLLDAIEAHPILLNRPLVVSPKGVRLCRPSEAVLDLLPGQQGEFVKEDGERVVDEHGRRVGTA